MNKTICEAVLTGGTIYPIVSKKIHNGAIHIKDGIIYSIGEDINSITSIENAVRFELDGKYILPGFIDAHTHLGIIEEGVGCIGKDNNETSQPLTPHIRAIDAVNPNDVSFTDALKAGITTVMTGPGSENVIGGLNMAVKTHGNIIDNMILKDPVGLKVSLGENPMTTYGGKGEMPVTRMGVMGLIRSSFYEALDYKEEKRNGNIKYRDLGLEALLLALDRVVPVRVHAHRADDIATAIRLSDEFNLRLVIEHGTEGYMIKDYLREKNVAVTVGPMLTPRDKMELKNRSYQNAVELAKTGVKIALVTDHPYNSIEHLRLAAVLTHKEGLSAEDTLASITINAADILNVDDRVGSLETGKDADIIVMDKDPLDIDSKVLMVFINGNIVLDRR